jgi:N-acetylneuraminic acid mutarotase
MSREAGPQTAVLYGGETGTVISSATWTWNGAAWTQLDVTGPPARYGGAMASLHGQLVLFGGDGGGLTSPHTYLADTWTWNGTAWTQLDVTGPPPRAGAMMAPVNGKLVMFGGQSTNEVYLVDTWTWDGTSWTAVDAMGPTARADGVMCAFAGEGILVGGYGDGGPYLADIWAWNGASWASVTYGVSSIVDASARSFGGINAVMAPLHGELVLFGGVSTEGLLTSDTYTWNGSMGSNGAAWVLRSFTGPPVRENSVVASVDGTIVMFGGQGLVGDGGFAHLAETWIWDGNSWTQANVPGPPALASAMMAVP